MRRTLRIPLKRDRVRIRDPLVSRDSIRFESLVSVWMIWCYVIMFAIGNVWLTNHYSCSLQLATNFCLLNSLKSKLFLHTRLGWKLGAFYSWALLVLHLLMIFWWGNGKKTTLKDKIWTSFWKLEVMMMTDDIVIWPTVVTHRLGRCFADTDTHFSH